MKLNTKWRGLAVKVGGMPEYVEVRTILKNETSVLLMQSIASVGTNLDPTTYARQIDIRHHQGKTYVTPVADDGVNPGEPFVVRELVQPRMALAAFKALFAVGG